MSYTGWFLPHHERERLLEMFKPRYPNVIAHHVTLQLGITTLPEDVYGKVVAIADDGNAVQALVVEIGSTSYRPDGNVYHITWSIDRSKGAKPVDSNRVIKSTPLEHVKPSVVIELIPMVFY